ncbi:MAG TPA: type II secretion system F family protein [Candidatus Aminicenantes bacterium]|nr:type II secretion system F family protein [Candidatus Aminicenantes bacterium]HRY64294.1 type II secretion system F family protein [Candidatus Aminicenantes bacterium]HRZ71207.1 type II secretion system F family protein [Candidatus Aminicenantes bacterium]
MATYVWKGKNRYGDMVGGERVAASKEELSRMLQKDQIQVLSIAPAKAGFKIPFLKREKVKLKDLSVYSRQLSVLIDAELPLIQSLGILEDQQKNAYFKNVIKTVKEDVEAGSTLNQAKRKHPKVFDDLYCNLIASGEQSGSLDVMLRRLSEFIEKTVRLRAKVKQAMIYPVAIVIFAITVAIFLLWKVIPIFANIFNDLGAELPGITALVVGLSNFVQKYIVYMIVGIIALVFLFRYYRSTTPGRWTTDRLVLKMPLFGKLLYKVAMTRVTRTLSTLISGGVPMLEALKITSTTAGNVVIEKEIIETRKLVSEGKTLSESFKQSGDFPLMMLQMINVGEATGTLDEMLNKLASFYDEEVDNSVAALLSILEPILLIFVGGMVGGLVVAMYLPIFSLMKAF